MEKELREIVKHAKDLKKGTSITRCNLIIELAEHLLSRLDSTNEGQGDDVMKGLKDSLGLGHTADNVLTPGQEEVGRIFNYHIWAEKMMDAHIHNYHSDDGQGESDKPCRACGNIIGKGDSVCGICYDASMAKLRKQKHEVEIEVEEE